MGIDPRTIKEMLQLQIWNKSSLLSATGSSDDSSEGGEFSELLNLLLAKQRQQPAETGAEAGKSAAKEPDAAKHAMRMAATSRSRYMHNDTASRPTDYEPIIREASRKFGVESSLVKAVIDAESSYNHRAVSRAGAKGLMQLMDSTGRALGVTDPFDPKQNIDGGTKYLSDLLAKYNGNQGTALAAYNAGSGRLDKLGIRNDRDLEEKLHLLPGETQQYVRKVMQLKQHYEA